MRDKSTTIKDKLPKVTHEGGSMATLQIMSNCDAELTTQLRNEIRQDMKDYKLLYTNENIGTDLAKSLLFGAGNSLCLNEVRFLFANYLNQQIDKNLTKLKKLIERSTNTGD